MSDISRAMAAKQASIKTLQADIEALRRAAGIMGAASGGTTPATPTRRRRKMSTTAKRAVSKRMKAYWAKKHAKR